MHNRTGRPTEEFFFVVKNFDSLFMKKLEGQT